MIERTIGYVDDVFAGRDVELVCADHTVDEQVVRLCPVLFAA
jgi:hypothetical protein